MGELIYLEAARVLPPNRVGPQARPAGAPVVAEIPVAAPKGYPWESAPPSAAQRGLRDTDWHGGPGIVVDRYV